MADQEEIYTEHLCSSPAHTAHIRGLHDLNKTEKYADFTITCNERSWKVHKAIVCPQSDYFSKMCDGEFEEAKRNAITLRDDDEEAVAAMIYYFYHLDYDSDRAAGKAVSPSVLDARVFAIADKYFIDPLQDIAINKIADRMTTQWNTKAFPEVVREVYSLEIPHIAKLKDAVLRVVAQHRELLTDDAGKFKAFQDMLREIGGLGADVAIAVAKRVDGYTDKKYQCPRCKGVFEVKPGVQSFSCAHSGAGCCGYKRPDWWDSYRAWD